jgi:Flp pilus assembly pilin Flp
MSSTLGLISRFLVSDDGPATVKYAVMLGLIVAAIASGTFSTVSSAVGIAG